VIGGLYGEGTRIVTGLQDLDGPNVNPVCHTRLYTHGGRTERALVLLHGFTSCPQQFDLVGRMFHAQGWNVLIPRYPRHGYRDRLNSSISELRAEHLIALANQSADAAHGLGEHVTVAGMSLGGSLAGYLAQTHDHVDRAVLIAPMFGLRWIPGVLQRRLGSLAYALPNFYIWWDASLKERLPPDYGYPRLSTHAYASLFNIASDTASAARTAAPKAREIAVLTNANEPGLENRFTYRLVEAWRAHGAHVSRHEFPLTDRLPHDLIDPSHPSQNTELVYPVVTRLIQGDDL
jgi:alpha-beta hydrolase superfamily lysophospholipase